MNFFQYGTQRYALFIWTVRQYVEVARIQSMAKMVLHYSALAAVVDPICRKTSDARETPGPPLGGAKMKPAT